MVKGAWGDGPFDFEGEHYRITVYDALAEAACNSPARRSWWAAVAARS